MTLTDTACKSGTLATEQTKAMSLTGIVALAITVGVAAASFALSFNALRDLATRGHIPRDQAWLWPLVVDGTIVLATLGVVVTAAHPLQRKARVFFWAVLVVSAAVSILCNALHAILPTGQPLNSWLTAFLAAVAPAALLATTHGVTLFARLQRWDTTARNARVTSWREPANNESANSDETQHVSRTAMSAAAVAIASDVQPAPALSSPAPVSPQPASLVCDPAEQTELQVNARWERLAPAVIERAALRTAGVDQVAQVLHWGFENAMTNREISRRLTMNHHTVGKIQRVGSELLAEQQLARL